MNRRIASRRHSGFTLIEMIVFIVVVSVGLAGILSVFNASVRGSADPMIRKQALAIAEATMEEVLLKRFADTSDNTCTPTTAPRCQANTPADRANYNDVAYYNNWDQTGVNSPDTFAAAVPGLEAYRVRIAVSDVTLNTVAMKEITVTVSAGDESITLTSHRGNYE